MSEELNTEEQGVVAELKSNKLLVVSFVVLLVAILGVAAYLGYDKYRETKNAESADAYSDLMFVADSVDVTEDYIAAADEYEGTPGGSIAATLGARGLMDKGEFDEALAFLEQVELEDIVVTATVQGLIGDCYSEKEMYSEAYEAYRKAAAHEPNQYTTAKYLMKAGLVAEELNNNDKALECYETIKKEYPAAPEANGIEKEIARVENM